LFFCSAHIKQSSKEGLLQETCSNILQAHVVVICVSRDYAADATSMSYAEYNFIVAHGKPLALARLADEVDFAHISYVSATRSSKASCVRSLVIWSTAAEALCE
jgi:hypothetical protein